MAFDDVGTMRTADRFFELPDTLDVEQRLVLHDTQLATVFLP
jgi:hypothetical protein